MNLKAGARYKILLVMSPKDGLQTKRKYRAKVWQSKVLLERAMEIFICTLSGRLLNMT